MTGKNNVEISYYGLKHLESFIACPITKEIPYWERKRPSTVVECKFQYSEFTSFYKREGKLIT